MILHQALTQCRTLVIEGRDGIGRSGLISDLARNGFLIRRSRGHLHHVDPTQPYRELLSAPGRLAVDGSIIHELVYGPLRRGHSRVTWIQALDFAEAVAERDGALVHVTVPQPVPQDRSTARLAMAAGEEDGTEAARAYERAFRTLAQHVSVITLDAGDLGHPIRAPGLSAPQLEEITTKLTVG